MTGHGRLVSFQSRIDPNQLYHAKISLLDIHIVSLCGLASIRLSCFMPLDLTDPGWSIRLNDVGLKPNTLLRI